MYSANKRNFIKRAVNDNNRCICFFDCVVTFEFGQDTERTNGEKQIRWKTLQNVEGTHSGRAPRRVPTPELHGGWSIQKFIVAEQHQEVEDGAKTHQEKGGNVYFGSKIHKAAQKFEKNEKKKRKKNREKMENRKFQASWSFT